MTEQEWNNLQVGDRIESVERGSSFVIDEVIREKNGGVETVLGDGRHASNRVLWRLISKAAPSCACGAPGEAASVTEATDTTDGANAPENGADGPWKAVEYSYVSGGKVYYEVIGPVSTALGRCQQVLSSFANITQASAVAAELNRLSHELQEATGGTASVPETTDTTEATNEAPGGADGPPALPEHLWLVCRHPGSAWEARKATREIASYYDVVYSSREEAEERARNLNKQNATSAPYGGYFVSERHGVWVVNAPGVGAIVDAFDNKKAARDFAAVLNDEAARSGENATSAPRHGVVLMGDATQERIELYVNPTTGSLAVYLEDNCGLLTNGTHNLTLEQTRAVRDLAARALVGVEVEVSPSFAPDATKGHWCDECKAGTSAHSRKVQDGRNLCHEHFAEWAESRMAHLERIAEGRLLDVNDARRERDTLPTQRDEAIAAWGEDARSLDAVRGDLRQCRVILAETQEALRKKCDQLDAVRDQRDKAVASAKMMLAWHKCEPGTFREAAMRVVSRLQRGASQYGDTFGALGAMDALHDIASLVRSKASRVITGDGSADADSMLDIAGYGILGMVRLAREGGE